MARLLVLLFALAAASGRVYAQGDPAPPAPPARPMAPELESALPPDQAWLNTDRPLRLSRELRGHVVLLDFWTHCCINCMHVLPDLASLEAKYAGEPFVVVGVHSAKFDSEGDRASIRDAIFREHIRHPVLIDTGMALWKRYGVRAWPSFVLIGADGRLIGITSGEGRREILDEAIGHALQNARDNGTLARRRVEIVPDRAPRAATGLSYPGKVLAAPPDPTRLGRGYVFVADSAHNRVVVAHWPDADGHASLLGVYGGGEAGFADAWSRDATFNNPQGMAFDPALGAQGTLYVADTGNHAIRAIDLDTGMVMTIVGNGRQSTDRRGGGRGRAQGLSSPWDLALTPDGRTLYVAMAGTHQLWQVDLADGARAEAIAGGIGENLIDGPARDAMLAQPSGLALSADARRLYFADSEASAVRVLDLERGRVGTIIGRGLFEFGDIDGAYPEARLQHCIGLTLYPTPEGERLLVADTYNDRIKLVHPFARTSASIFGVGGDEQAAPGRLDLNEPAGVSYAPGSADGARRGLLFIADTNNHRVVMADPSSGEHREVILDLLTPPPHAGGPAAGATPLDAIAAATPVSVALSTQAPITLVLDAELPVGATVNAEAPVSVRVWRVPRPGDRMPPRVIVQATLPGVLPARVEVPAEAVRDGALWLVELSFAWCEHGQSATCRPGEAQWRVDVSAGDAAETTLRAVVR
jgi:sugar lactone lactonase YvrE